MKLIYDAEDRKLFTRVVSPEKFGLRKYSLRKTQEKPRKNQENIECIINKNVDF